MPDGSGGGERLAGSGVCGYGAEVSEMEGRTIGARRQC